MCKLPKKLNKRITYLIHKVGSMANVKDYIPVSHIPHINKLIEKIITKKSIMFLEKSDLLNNIQRGFHQGRNCLTQLLQHYDWVLKKLLDMPATVYTLILQKHLIKEITA